MPTHCLKLELGAGVMLLRNLHLKTGICNGTRMIVRCLTISRCRSFGDVKIQEKRSESQGYLRQECFTKNMV